MTLSWSLTLSDLHLSSLHLRLASKTGGWWLWREWWQRTPAAYALPQFYCQNGLSTYGVNLWAVCNPFSLHTIVYLVLQQYWWNMMKNYLHLIFSNILATPCALQHLSSLTRDWTPAAGVKARILTPRPTGNSPSILKVRKFSNEKPHYHEITLSQGLAELQLDTGNSVHSAGPPWNLPSLGRDPLRHELLIPRVGRVCVHLFQDCFSKAVPL